MRLAIVHPDSGVSPQFTVNDGRTCLAAGRQHKCRPRTRTTSHHLATGLSLLAMPGAGQGRKTKTHGPHLYVCQEPKALIRVSRPCPQKHQMRLYVCHQMRRSLTFARFARTFLKAKLVFLSKEYFCPEFDSCLKTDSSLNADSCLNTD